MWEKTNNQVWVCLGYTCSPVLRFWYFAVSCDKHEKSQNQSTILDIHYTILHQDIMHQIPDALYVVWSGIRTLQATSASVWGIHHPHINAGRQRVIVALLWTSPGHLLNAIGVLISVSLESLSGETNIGLPIITYTFGMNWAPHIHIGKYRSITDTTCGSKETLFRPVAVPVLWTHGQSRCATVHIFLRRSQSCWFFVFS